MNARAVRAVELASAAFVLIRSQGSIVERDALTRDITILWASSGTLSARVFTRGSRVHLEVWMAHCVLAMSRVTGAADCEIEQYSRGSWEGQLLRLALADAGQLPGVTVH